MQVRYDQKMAKYGCVAEQNNLRFIPVVFSHTGQIHGEFKTLFKEHIRHMISKVRSVMKWWSKCISMAIAKIAFKVARMRESI